MNLSVIMGTKCVALGSSVFPAMCEIQRKAKKNNVVELCYFLFLYIFTNISKILGVSTQNYNKTFCCWIAEQSTPRFSLSMCLRHTYITKKN